MRVHVHRGKGAKDRYIPLPESTLKVLREFWLATPSTFLFPEAVASPIYRQKFREILRAAGLEKNVDPSVWHKWCEVAGVAVSGQRMMRMKTRKASGRASALRVGHTIALTVNFKTRIAPCRIAVRAELGRSVNSDDKRAIFGGIWRM